MRGVLLELGGVELSWGELRLVGVVARPVGVEGAVGRADTVAVSLEGITPTRIAVEHLSASLEGVSVLGDLAGWAARSARPSEGEAAPPADIPIEIAEVEVGWREKRAREDVIRLTAAGLSLARTTGALRAARAELDDRRYGPADLSWRTAEDGVDVALGSLEPGAARITLSVRPGEASVRFRPIAIGEIAEFLSIELPKPDVEIDGSASIELRDGAGPAELAGRAEIRIEGFVPPHPRELDGILFGETTEVAVEITVGEDRRRIDLAELAVTAGALELTGTGAITADLDRSTAKLSLAGSVPCRSLTASAIAAHFGRTAGVIAGQLARAAMTGSVGVKLAVTATTDAFDEPDVETTASIGCRIDLLQGLPKPKL